MEEKKELNVYEKLQKARVLLQQKNLKKSGENKYSGFKYFELSDFLPAINIIFNELGLFSAINYDEKEATLIIHNSSKPEEQILFNSPNAEIQLKGCHSIQNIGAVETYQRRYLYMTALEIAENDILDFTSGSDKQEQSKQQQKQDNQVQENQICENCGKVIRPYKGRSIADIVAGSVNTYGKKLCSKCCIEQGKKEKIESK